MTISHCRHCNKQTGTAALIMHLLLLVIILPCLCQAWIAGGGSVPPPRPTRRIIGTTTTTTDLPPTTATSTPTTSTSTTALYVTKTLKRVRDSITNQERTDEELKIGIAGFYDRSSALWLETWGEHMHHGYYIPANRTDHKQAQIDLIDQVLKWAHVDIDNNDNNNNNIIIQSMVDVGCGVGGSSRHIAKMLNCNRVEGITLSPFQANKANEMAKDQNLQDTCHFQVADALQMPFDDNTFDLVWSLESGEHMPNKSQFVSELFRVAKPGTGRIILVTWCHRDLLPNETELTKREQKLLRKINRAYYLPKWCSVQDYVDLFQNEHNGATDIKRDDWSYIIAPFWKAVIRSSLNWKSIYGLLKAGFSTQRGAYAMFLMLRGFNQGLIKFGLLTCTKPPSSESESSSTIQQTKE